MPAPIIINLRVPTFPTRKNAFTKEANGFVCLLLTLESWTNQLIDWFWFAVSCWVRVLALSSCQLLVPADLTGFGGNAHFTVFGLCCLSRCWLVVVFLL